MDVAQASACVLFCTDEIKTSQAEACATENLSPVKRASREKTDIHEHFHHTSI